MTGSKYSGLDEPMSSSRLINPYLKNNREELKLTFNTVEGDAVKMINTMLANVNNSLLS